MVTREEVIAEILKIPEKRLDEVFRVIKKYESPNENDSPDDNVMAELRKITIAAAPDFSINVNLYDLEEGNAD